MIFKKMRRKTIRRIMIIMLLIAFLCAGIYSVFEQRLSVVIQNISANTVKSKAGIIINTAIYDEIESSEITYDKLVKFEKNANGDISALKTDIIEINKLKNILSVKILNELSHMDTAELDIPLGTVIGGQLLVGKGPSIKVNVVPVGSVETAVLNEITSAGINQSKHQIMLKITADLTIITSVTTLKTQVVTYICIAETVIVGDVPESYTNIDTSEEVLDKYNDYVL